MVDLSAEMAELWASLGSPPPGRACAIQFVAARRGEGTSTIARELAWFVAKRTGRKVWLVDLDVFTGPQYEVLAGDAKRYGAMGPAVAASPDDSIFLTVQPPQPGRDGHPVPDARYVVAHAVEGARLWVTRFRREVLKGGQAVHYGAQRRILERAAPLRRRDHRRQPLRRPLPGGPDPWPLPMDQTVLVVAADQPDISGPAQLRDAIASAGGRCGGLFFNRAQVRAPGFLKRFLP